MFGLVVRLVNHDMLNNIVCKWRHEKQEGVKGGVLFVDLNTNSDMVWLMQMPSWTTQIASSWRSSPGLPLEMWEVQLLPEAWATSVNTSSTEEGTFISNGYSFGLLLDGWFMCCLV